MVYGDGAGNSAYQQREGSACNLQALLDTGCSSMLLLL